MESILILILILVFGAQLVTIFYLIGELLNVRNTLTTTLTELRDLKRAVFMEISNFYARKENE